MATPSQQPNPAGIFNAFNAYQVTFALKGAIELSVFTHIADGATSADEPLPEITTSNGVRSSLNPEG